MNLIIAAALFGAGYIYRDHHVYTKPVYYRSGHDRPDTFRQYFKNLAMDKMDLLFYAKDSNRNRKGYKPKIKYEPRRSSYFSSNPSVDSYDSNIYRIDSDKYYSNDGKYSKAYLIVYNDSIVDDASGDQITYETFEKLVGKEIADYVTNNMEHSPSSLYVRNEIFNTDYEIVRINSMSFIAD